MVRADRNTDRRGGGVLLAIKKQVPFEIININCDNEWVIIKIRYKKVFLYVSVVYFVPGSIIDVYEAYFKVLEDMLLFEKCSVIMLGDFNLPHFLKENCEKSILMQQFLSIHNLKQYNSVSNHMDRFLDLVIANVDVFVNDASDMSLVPVDRYHPALNVSLYIEKVKNQNQYTNKYTYNYSQGNFLLLHHLIEQCDWSNVLACRDASACLDAFYINMYRCLDASIPKYKVRENVNMPRYPTWFSIDLVRTIQKKNNLHRIVNRDKSNVQQYNEYIALRQTIKYQVNFEYEAYVRSLEHNLNNDPRRFWSFISDRSDFGGLPRTMNYNGNKYDESRDIANAFAQYFASVYMDPSCKDTSKKSQNLGIFNFKEIDDSDVINSIKKLKPKKSTGPDCIPSYIYKGCMNSLVKPLVHIFNLAIQQNQFPDSFKKSIISPIHKSGCKKDIENYRPISLSNCLSKIFEIILHQDLYSYVNKIITPYQHGFVCNKSTITNLAIFTEYASKAIDNKQQLDAIYTDCAKAFDKVDHNILLFKLIKLGLSTSAIRFMESYLSDRTQVVKVAGCQSEQIEVTSGVPQGSNLGPLLFILFINDLPECVTSSYNLMYADDFKLFRVVSAKNDCAQLQCDLTSVSDWFKVNNMELNIDKCFVVSFTRNINYIAEDYYIGGVKIKRKVEVKDLGVTYQMNMKFNKHYINIANKAYKVLGFVIRNSKKLNISTIIRLYNALVRPILEYASYIWLPQVWTNIDSIEKIQKRFLRFLYVRQNNTYPYMVSYSSMLKSFKLVSLNVRRKIHAVLFVYFILNNIKYQDCNIINFIKFKVPKIQLRILDKDLFYVDTGSISSINKMLSICNEFLNINKNVDIFNVKHNELKVILMHQDTWSCL